MKSVVASPVERQATPRPPAHEPESTSATTGDPGSASIADDLQKVAVRSMHETSKAMIQNARG
jgi:hypothetical protein